MVIFSKRLAFKLLPLVAPLQIYKYIHRKETAFHFALYIAKFSPLQYILFSSQNGLREYNLYNFLKASFTTCFLTQPNMGVLFHIGLVIDVLQPVETCRHRAGSMLLTILFILSQWDMPTKCLNIFQLYDWITNKNFAKCFNILVPPI